MKKMLLSVFIFAAASIFVCCTKDESKNSISGTVWVGKWFRQNTYKLVEFTSEKDFYECYCDEDGNLINPSDPYHGKNYGTYSIDGDDIDFLTHDTYSTEFDRGVLKNNRTRLDIYLAYSETSVTFHMK